MVRRSGARRLLALEMALVLALGLGVFLTVHPGPAVGQSSDALGAADKLSDGFKRVSVSRGPVPILADFGHAAPLDPRRGRGLHSQLERFDHSLGLGTGQKRGLIVRGGAKAAPEEPSAASNDPEAASGGDTPERLAMAGLPDLKRDLFAPGPGPSRLKPGLRPLSWPLSGSAINSAFGMRRHPVLGEKRFHAGVDLAAKRGTPVLAAADGEVVVRARRGGYGRYLRLRHGFGLETVYGHLQGYAQEAWPGRRVRRGQVIGYVGSSGLATGPHLHYEVILDGRALDPQSVQPPIPRRVSAR